jgi:hypothetical protein
VTKIKIKIIATGTYINTETNEQHHVYYHEDLQKFQRPTPFQAKTIMDQPLRS